MIDFYGVISKARLDVNPKRLPAGSRMTPCGPCPSAQFASEQNVYSSLKVRVLLGPSSNSNAVPRGLLVVPNRLPDPSIARSSEGTTPSLPFPNEYKTLWVHEPSALCTSSKIVPHPLAQPGTAPPSRVVP